MTTNRILDIRRDAIERVSRGRYVTEASAIGIAPGAAWPRIIAVGDGRDEVLFRFDSASRHDGELSDALYVTWLGDTRAALTVYND